MADSMDAREREQRRVARMMQEKAENKRELAQALHVWRGKMLANDACCVLPGDYMAVGHGCMCSSRGALLSMSEDDLHAMIEGGALSKVFRMGDVNGPDMDAQLDFYMGQIVRQRHYADASSYHVCTGDLERAIAVYDMPEPASGSEKGSEGPMLTVERNGGRFAFHTGSWDGGVPMRQCSYEEFNPGGAEMIRSLESEAKPEQGRSKSVLREKMEREYLNNGENRVAKPDEAIRQIPGYENMSPSERLAKMVELKDEYHKALERSVQQEQAPSSSDQWGPRLPGERRGH